MLGFLRLVGILNAAIWVGSVFFFTFAAAPAFFSQEMKEILPAAHAGAAAQVVIYRYFLLQLWCAGVALAHLVAEWLYSGRPLKRITLMLLMSLFILNIFGAYVLLPKMKELHLKKHSPQTTAEIKNAASRSFRILHVTSTLLNLLVIPGVLVYLWQVTKPVNTARFTSVNRFTV